MAPFPGGVLLKSKQDGCVIGAIGVSGAAGDEDEYCAIIAAAQSLFGDAIVFEPARHALKL